MIDHITDIADYARPEVRTDGRLNIRNQTIGLLTIDIYRSGEFVCGEAKINTSVYSLRGFPLNHAVISIRSYCIIKCVSELITGCIITSGIGSEVRIIIVVNILLAGFTI